MNDSFPTTVSGVARDHFQLWFRQPVEAQDASRVPSRRGPKTRAAASSVGGITEWEVIRYRETRFRTPV